MKAFTKRFRGNAAPRPTLVTCEKELRTAGWSAEAQVVAGAQGAGEQGR